MKSNHFLLIFGIGCVTVTSSVLAQTPTGNNTTGALSLESQTSSPAGQTDFQTDPFTGRFGYTVPLDLAPARHDSTPSMELSYNSANPNGWCGVGWALDLGYIERETKYGVPVLWSGGQAQAEYDDSKGYVFSFKSKSSDLVSVGGGAWRAQIQNDFSQFQLQGSSNTWVVTDKSGNQYFFGSTTNSRMVNPKSGWSATATNGTFHWSLDTIITATGDKASITYTTANGKLYPQTYTYNGHVNGISQLYSVQFYLTTTNRTDTTISCRSGYQVIQQYLLSGIAHTVNGQLVWSNQLNYTTSTSTERSLLTSITRYGADQSTTLPPLTFGYSKQNFTFQSPVNWTNLFYATSASDQTTYYYGFNNPYTDLVDVDGDGFPDRIVAPYSTPSTNWWVQHNNGSNGFDNPTLWTVGFQTNSENSTKPDSTWAQFNTHGTVIDINGDGLPDLIVDPLEMFSGGGYTRQVVQLNNGTNLLSQFSWTNVIDQYSNAYFNPDGNYRAVQDGTYVAMLDMNGDGLPDRVMMLPGGALNYYLVQFNTGSGFTSTNAFGPYTAQGATNDMNWAGLNGSLGYSWLNGSGASSMRMFDINGDGLPDRVMLVHSTNSTGAAPAQNQTYLVVELNNGHGFEPAINWTNVNAYYGTNCGGGTTSGIQDLGDDYEVAYRDVNGDGLPDRIIACQCSANPYTNWLVQINTGTGFGPLINWGPVNSQGQSNEVNYCGIQSTVPVVGAAAAGITMLLDMNGDGLPDRVEFVYNSTDSSNFYVVELSSGPLPDLLTIASNGLGGVVTAAYKPSTQYDNRASTNTSPAQYLLPFPIPTVSSVSVGDGIYPSNTTTYNYTGGYWNYSLRQFNGFAQTTVVDPLGMTNIHWFHQAGGRNNSSFGEYQDSTNSLGKEGMEYRVDTIGSDGNPYQLVLNQINEAELSGGQHFAYLDQTITVDYPATSSAYKATAKQYFYNTNNGNLTNTTDWGQVTSVVINGQSFTDVAGDTVYQITQFASLSNTNIVDKPQSITLSTDSAGADILRQENFSYDGSTGDTLQERDLICTADGGEYRTNSYGYDTYNNEKWETNAAGIVTQITYESTYETFPSQTTVGGSYTTSTTYDPRSGKLYLSTDPAGLVTSNRYDVFLRLAETDVSTTPNGSTTEWLEKDSYTLGVSGGPQNSVFRQQSDGVDTSNGHETVSYFDGLCRTIQMRKESETSGTFRVIDTVYDKRGNVEFTSLPYFSTSGTNRTAAASGLGTLRGYDPIGRVNQLTASVAGTFSSGQLTGTSATAGDSGSPVGSSSVAYYYNSDPWTWVVTDEAGTVHRYTLDAYGQTNQIVEVNGSQNYTTLLNWNLAGDLLSVTDNSNNVIQYSNNLMGEVVGIADPDMGVWQYQRDYAGRMRQQTDGDGQMINYNYSPDPLGRLLNRQVYDLKGNFYYGITNIYDTNSGDTTFPVYLGQLYKTIDSEGFTEYGYDVQGRKIITRRYLVKNGNTYTNQYAYDDMDRTRSIIYPNNGPTVTNIYDTGANLSEVQQVGGSGTTYYHATSFTPLDQISSITYGNGLTATQNYYANSKRLQSVTTSGSLQSLSYTYDAVADILSISDGDYSGAASASISSVSYDSLHRLLGLTRPGTSQTVSCAYDAIGDILTNSENGSAAYTYGNRLPHAIKTANGLNYAYDLCGNMLVRGTQSLVYNPENRLIVSAVSNQVTTFGYDADGSRLWKQGAPTNTLQVWIDGNYEEKDGKILFHVSAGDRIVCTFDASNTVFEYYHPDHLHSANVISGSSGGLYQHYEYSAYGQSRYTSSSTAFPISRRYTSQVLDEETGLYYYGARYYDPQLGRFVQPDSIIPNPFDPQAYDRYAYARNNPLKYTDPTGHAPEDYLPFRTTYLEIQGQNALDEMVRAHTDYGSYSQYMAAHQSAVPTAGDMGAISATAHLAGDATSAYTTALPDLATAGMATAPIAITKVGQAAEETGAGVVSQGANILENGARGRASEARVLSDLGQAKNTGKVFGKEGTSIPDFQNQTTIGEIKDTQRVTDSRQLRIQKEAAQQSGRAHELQTGVNTAVSENAAKGTTVVRRPDLGPQTPPPSQ
jgi:RHS repeat-associated protein